MLNSPLNQLWFPSTHLYSSLAVYPNQYLSWFMIQKVTPSKFWKFWSFPPLKKCPSLQFFHSFFLFSCFIFLSFSFFPLFPYFFNLKLSVSQAPYHNQFLCSPQNMCQTCLVLFMSTTRCKLKTYWIQNETYLLWKKNFN